MPVNIYIYILKNKPLQNQDASLLISLFFLIMIPKSSKALFESIFDGGITVCCHGVRFSFSEWKPHI